MADLTGEFREFKRSRADIEIPFSLGGPYAEDANEEHGAYEAHAEFEGGCDAAFALADEVFREVGKVQCASA
jgi:hypothetical protein